MLKITGGTWRGHPLTSAPDPRTRPSAARLRETLFAVLGDLDLPVADLFAGSGSLGLEALSRGAPAVSFVEMDPRAVRTIRRNLEALGAPRDRWSVRRGDARRWLARPPEAPGATAWDVLADPPWVEDLPAQFLPLASRLIHSGVLRRFVLEHPAEAVFPTLPDARVTSRTRTSGRSAFTLLEPATP